MLNERAGGRAFACLRLWHFMPAILIALCSLRGHPALAQGGMSVSEPASRPGSMSRLYFDGHQAIARGDLADAERDFREAIQRMSNQSVVMGDDCQANAYEGLGAVYFHRGQYAEAAQTLEKSVGLYPRLVMAQTLLGRSYYELHQNSKAVAALEVALQLAPQDPVVTLYLGKAKLAMGDSQGASDILAKLAESRPDALIVQALSAAYMQSTMQRLSAQGKFAPHSFEAFQVAAVEAQARADYQEVVDDCRQALSIKPNAVGVHNALGDALLKLGRREEAASAYKKEAEINPKDSAALWKLGALTLHRDPQEARGYLERSLRLNPQRVAAVLDYGETLALTGETQKAIEQYRRVVAMDPQRARAHYLLAAAYRSLGQQAEAATELAQFEKLSKQKSERDQQRVEKAVEAGSGGSLVSDGLDSGGPASPARSSPAPGASPQHP